MIDPKELRLGNAVHVRDSSPIGEQNSFIVEITSDELSIDKDNKLPGICCFPDELIGILLTPEVLRQCGFVNSKDDKEKWLQYPDKEYEHFIEFYSHKAEFYIESFEGCCSVPIKYLHQLQNLIFALTGEELQVNFPK